MVLNQNADKPLQRTQNGAIATLQGERGQLFSATYSASKRSGKTEI